MEELQEQLQALKERVVADKAAMAALKDINDSLNEQLQQQGSPVTSRALSSPQPEETGVLGDGAAGPRGRERVIYVPKEKKCPVFNEGSCAEFYEWLDEINAVLGYRHFEDTEKAMYIYDHLGGEARQEVRYRSQSERRDPRRILEILKEVYGQPDSLTRLQKLFFDRRQRERESVREYSHGLMAIIDDINHCDIKQAWCSDFALRDQFAENVRDLALRRELKKVIRQNNKITFFGLREEALRWEDGEPAGGQSRRVTNSCEMGAVESNTIVGAALPEPDPLLVEILQTLKQQQVQVESTLKKQQAQIFDLAQKVSDLSGLGISWQGVRGDQPRFDADGQPICFKCRVAGHMARQCPVRAPNRGAAPVLRHEVSRDRLAQVAEQQGNSPPLW